VRLEEMMVKAETNLLFSFLRNALSTLVRSLRTPRELAPPNRPCGVSARELTIAVAVALGVVVLKEPLTPTKALSAAAIILGVFLVKLA
jgi:drug/metabolite transporter (DMT)-like permease